MKITAKTVPGQWLILSLGLVAFLEAPIAQVGPSCDIELPQSVYNLGDDVATSVYRLTNPAAESVQIEWKMWLDAPPPFDQLEALVSMGARGSLALPADFDVDFAELIGPILIFTPDGEIFGPGEYVLGCRLLNPITGEETSVDEVVFEVQ